MLVATHMMAASALCEFAQATRLYKEKPKAWRPAILLLAFASHFALDAIPHYDLGVLPNGIIGACVIAFLLYEARKTGDGLLLAAAFLGALPDALFFLEWGTPVDRFHYWIHFRSANPLPFFLVILELAVVPALAFVLARRRSIVRSDR
ncbi:hypothetical protein J19TS2_03320 [Cohnella xylanilytica]|uniref:Uncharacterized protein n=1 Tax=Cohnella xylanilytica TaxID=557555 RepID=A0A841U627_9BACL|nr:hypothetical protein [Cohnella xylanilytica]MBB6696086.1 hypothetical protein [Cohnella xylanilytica]GIO10777.1 hypothetical protein J19TS2_03320 [Cohnella xylanilytica]